MKLQELFEAAVEGKELQLDKVDVETAIGLLNTHCKDALWMLQKNAPIWRGQATFKGKFIIIDPSKSERRSQNTKNYYTELLDYNPLNAKIGLPKRRFSIIGSTDYARAKVYASWENQPYAVIPFDGVKIGCVGNEDIWDTEIEILGTTKSIDMFNEDEFPRLFKDDTIESMKKLSDKLASGDKGALRRVQQVFELESNDYNDIIKPDFLGYLFKCYGPKSTKFKVATSATVDTSKKQEVWIGGKCVLIKYNIWKQMVKAFKQQSRQLAATAK